MFHCIVFQLCALHSTNAIIASPPPHRQGVGWVGHVPQMQIKQRRNLAKWTRTSPMPGLLSLGPALGVHPVRQFLTCVLAPSNQRPKLPFGLFVPHARLLVFQTTQQKKKKHPGWENFFLLVMSSSCSSYISESTPPPAFQVLLHFICWMTYD